jgi:hypothetical protein
MASKTVSQKRFSKGINNATGSLSEQQGSVVRASNLLLTQRGSLQVCDGSASIGTVSSTYTKMAVIDAFSKNSSGEYPNYVVLSFPGDVLIPDIDEEGGSSLNFFEAIPTHDSSGSNAAGSYYFAIVAYGDAVTGEHTNPTYYAMGTLQAFNTVTFQWTPVNNATSYSIYYLASASSSEGTLLSSTITESPYVYTGTLTAGTTSLPTGNTSYLLQLFIGTITPPSTTVTFNEISAATFLAQSPQPAPLAPGDPNFAFSTVKSSTTTYSPTTTTISASVVATQDNQDPTNETATISDFSSEVLTSGESLTLVVSLSGYIDDSGDTGNGYVEYEYSYDSGSTWNVFYEQNSDSNDEVTWDETVSVSLDESSLTNLDTLYVRIVSHAEVGDLDGASVTSSGTISGIYLSVISYQSFSPSGGIVGQACPIPQLLQFVSYEILLLGNGLTPYSCDPSAGSSTTITALENTYEAAYPAWTASVTWTAGDEIYVLDGTTKYLLEATQGGTAGTTEPTWAYTKNAETADGSVIWTSEGEIYTNVAPRGAAHGITYAGSLWLANTYPQTTSDELDGPTCIKMSESNNPNQWNPVNTAFIGKDDGTQLTGMASFTIAALGISPTGSLAVFKEYLTYQIIGVFGSTSFEIQPAQTDMGCLAARSIQFIPGFGIIRFSHLGFSVYDGVSDRVVSEEIRPYLFGGIEQDSDIVAVDMTYVYLSKSAQSTNPPMYMCALPLSGGNGDLTRIFCYDLIMKSWVVIDLPWTVTAMNRVRIGEGSPLVLAGKTDGTVQRLQTGDTTWGDGSVIAWSFQTQDVFGEGGSQRIFYREMVLRGHGTISQAQKMKIVPTVDGTTQAALIGDVISQGTNSNLFEVRVSLWLNGQMCHLDISGTGQCVIDSIDWMIEPKSSSARRIIG